MKILFCLGVSLAFYLISFAAESSPPEVVAINNVPWCIEPWPDGVEQCPTPDEVFCATTCPNAGTSCFELDSTTRLTSVEIEQLNSGTATEIFTYPACQPGDVSCKISQSVDTIACYSETPCICEGQANTRTCTLGQQKIHTLFKYKPHRRIACAIAPPAP